jgi:hypothetical protein
MLCTMQQALQPQIYRIVVEGEIDPMWHDCLGGLTLAEERCPDQPVFTQLEGRLLDQSALHGVIATLFMLDLRLVRVERLPTHMRLDA